MTDVESGAVVIDTMVISWLVDERPNLLAERYRALIGLRPVLLPFQTVMELRYGAQRAGWGDLRRRRLDRRIGALTIVQPDDETITACAALRVQCQQAGHPLGHKLHDGDRWIAAIAIRLDVPLVSHDRVFAGAPRLKLLTAFGDH
ncbi:hypothetical protein BST11_09915 [Mycobacterium alsense]|uniref:Ribonuclease VapC n=1 Tax=Mycobacterium alsense TaxID=324058 RepID=A0AA41XR45_9MYCO|nr:PIN domain-containing protein [Mycobacterium alsense]MCV7379815.1 PIN domain-containing protein [Mycobacterium alsense]OQZ91143.1 hypothetical protein BST11_09915 [Mycobacterium alsense]